jgi:hypothetical protein
MKYIVAVKLTSLVFLIVLLSGCTDSHSPYQSSDVQLKKYSWKGKIPRAHRVKVINPYGNIDSRTGSYQIIDITGVMQLIGPDAKKAQVEIREENDVTIIEVKYPSGIYDELDRRIARFDIGVFVPTGVVLELETDFGDIKIKKHRNRIFAKTNSGNIAGSTKNIIHAFTQSGNINLNLMPWKSRRFAQLSKRPRYFINSDQGDIALSMNDDLAVDIRLFASQPIISNNEFVQNALSKNQKQLALTHKNPSRILEAKTKKGALKIDLYKKAMVQRTSLDKNEQGEIKVEPSLVTKKTNQSNWPANHLINISDQRFRMIF